MMVLFIQFFIIISFMSHHNLPELRLNNYKWENRIILIFSDADNPQYRKQADKLLNDKPGLIDRDLLVFHIDKKSPIKELLHSNEFDPDSNLRSRFDVPDSDFYVLLIGKDGGVKYRDDSPLAREKLYSIIDAMPMRQAEMRRKN